MMLSAKMRAGMPVENMPTPRPEMMLVADPVRLWRAMPLTGRLPVAVKNSVTNPMSVPATSPMI